MNDGGIEIKLTKDEALVLFDWLSRFNQNHDSKFEDQAEQRVLWDIEAALESLLAEPLMQDYKIRLLQARSNLRDPEE